ncbi:MAG TPA: hypothetical protein VGA78_11690 [Gemmatimonadales bacterium]
MPRIMGQVDGGHAALPQLAVELLSVGEHGAEPGEHLGHRPHR